MARRFVTASSHYLEIDQASVSAYPFTVAGWFNAATLHSGAIWSVADKDVSTEIWTLETVFNEKIRARVRAGTVTDQFATTTNLYTAGTWNHAALVATSATLREVYLNASVAGKGSNATNKTPIGLDRTNIGRLAYLVPDSYFNGRLAQIGLWDTTLLPGELWALAHGKADPWKIRPSNLVALWGLGGRYNPEPDSACWRYPLTVFGATPAEDPVFLGAQRRAWNRLVYPPAGAAAGFQPAWGARANTFLGTGLT